MKERFAISVEQPVGVIRQKIRIVLKGLRGEDSNAEVLIENRLLENNSLIGDGGTVYEVLSC